MRDDADTGPRARAGALATLLGLPGQVVRGLRTVGWVVRNGLRGEWVGAGGITLLNVIAIAAGATAIAGAIGYARFLSSGKSLVIRGWEPPLSDTPNGVVATAGVLAVLGVAAAGLLHLSEWLITRVARRYRIRCSRLVLGIASDPEYRGWARLVDDPRRDLARMTGFSAKVSANVLRFILRGILPIVTFLAALTLLVIANPQLTALLLPLGLIIGIGLLLVNRDVARTQRVYLDTMPRSGRILRSGVGVATDPELTTDEKMTAIDEHLARQPVIDAGRLFYRRRLADSAATAATASFLVAALFLLFTFYAIRAARGEADWAELLLYLVALQFAVGALKSVSGLGVRLSRLLPEYGRLYSFVGRAEALRDERRTLERGPLPDRLELRCGRMPLGGDRKCELRRGSIHWILSPGGRQATDLERIAAQVEHRLVDRRDLLDVTETVPGSDSAEDAAEALFVAAPRNGVVQRFLRRETRPFLFLHTSDPDVALESESEADGAVAVVLVMDGRRVVGSGDLGWLRDRRDAVRDVVGAEREADGDETDDELDLELDG